jgi:hypothetical protein
VLSKNPLLFVIPVAVVAGVVSLWAIRAANSGTDSESGLRDGQRTSVHATVVAQSGEDLVNNAIAFARSGQSPDGLPRAEIESFAAIATTDPQKAAKDSDAVALVQSEGGYVDETSGRLHVRLRTIESMKGGVGDSFDITMAGGPRKQPDGSWVLAVAPYELYLAKGETAILLLTSQFSPDGLLGQRPYEAMAISDGKIVGREGFAFTSLAGEPVEQATRQLTEGRQ